jgi:hypothetical protein
MVVVEELEEENSEVVKRAVDYGHVADSFVDEDDEEFDDEDEDEYDDDDDDSGSDDDQAVLLMNPLGGDDGDGNDESGDEEDEESEHEASDNSDSNDEVEDDEEEEADDPETIEQRQRSAQTLTSSTSSLGEQCTFDLRNLVAMNTHQLSVNDLYTVANDNKQQPIENVTIPGEKLPVAVNEAHLLEKALDGCTQLISVLWQLPTESSDVGQLASLPPYDEIKLPRALVRLTCWLLSVHMCAISPSLMLEILLLSATSGAKKRNQMGEIRQRSWNSTKQSETYSKGMG